MDILNTTLIERIFKMDENIHNLFFFLSWAYDSPNWSDIYLSSIVDKKRKDVAIAVETDPQLSVANDVEFLAK